MKKAAKYILLAIIPIMVISCQEENLPPFCKITSPNADFSIKKGESFTVNIEANDEDGVIIEVGLLLDQTKIGTIYKDPYAFDIETADLGKGTYRLSAYAVDDQGLNSSSSINITIEVFSATLTTDTVKDVTTNSLVCGGDITDNGGAEVTERGICWKMGKTPVIDDHKLVVDKGTGLFSTILEGLESNTTYHIRAYAINESGVAYGNEIICKTPYETDSYRDPRDGKVYKTVKIGENWWMAENLTYLPNVTVPQTGSDSIAYNYVYDQLTCGCLGKAKAKETFKTYGVLYNWTAAQAIVPEGWHVATNEEWTELEEFISSNNGDYENTNLFWENIGGHLKTATGWDNDSNGTDDYGFSGLPGGFRSEAGEFLGLTHECFFWTATETDKSQAWGRTINVESSQLHLNTFHKSNGFSVRCVKNK